MIELRISVSLLLILARFVIRFELLFSGVDPRIFLKIKIRLKLVFSKILDVQLGSVELNLNLNADMTDTRFLQQLEKEFRIITKIKTTDQNHDRVWNQIRHTNKFTEDLKEEIMNSTELVQIHTAKLTISEPTVDIIGNIFISVSLLLVRYNINCRRLYYYYIMINQLTPQITTSTTPYI